MTSLFRSFDITLFLYRYVLILNISIIIFSRLFKSTARFKFLNILRQEILIKFFYTLKPKNFNKSSSLIVIAVIISILLINVLSVFSYRFPFSSQFGRILALGLTLWLRFVLFSIFSNPKGFILHFIPEGTPIPLTIFLFLIEVVRAIIRPITLAVRLVANILAGHLLMILLSKLVFSVQIIFVRYIFLNGVELLVALIQAYIFSTIITLYFSEIH